MTVESSPNNLSKSEISRFTVYFGNGLKQEWWDHFNINEEVNEPNGPF